MSELFLFCGWIFPKVFPLSSIGCKRLFSHHFFFLTPFPPLSLFSLLKRSLVSFINLLCPSLSYTAPHVRDSSPRPFNSTTSCKGATKFFPPFFRFFFLNQSVRPFLRVYIWFYVLAPLCSQCFSCTALRYCTSEFNRSLPLFSSPTIFNFPPSPRACNAGDVIFPLNSWSGCGPTVSLFFLVSSRQSTARERFSALNSHTQAFFIILFSSFPPSWCFLSAQQFWSMVFMDFETSGWIEFAFPFPPFWPWDANYQRDWSDSHPALPSAAFCFYRLLVFPFLCPDETLFLRALAKGPFPFVFSVRWLSQAFSLILFMCLKAQLPFIRGPFSSVAPCSPIFYDCSFLFSNVLIFPKYVLTT